MAVVFDLKMFLEALWYMQFMCLSFEGVASLTIVMDDPLQLHQLSYRRARKLIKVNMIRAKSQVLTKYVMYPFLIAVFHFSCHSMDGLMA